MRRRAVAIGKNSNGKVVVLLAVEESLYGSSDGSVCLVGDLVCGSRKTRRKCCKFDHIDEALSGKCRGALALRCGSLVFFLMLLCGMLPIYLIPLGVAHPFW